MLYTKQATVYRIIISATLLAGLLLLSAMVIRAATQTDIVGPTGSEQFGQSVKLANGNIIVVDAGYDAGAIADVGAVYLYDGTTGALISTLTGSTANNYVGGGSVTELSNGNYVVSSPSWDNGGVENAGAVTWCSGVTGCTGTVSPANSLVGAGYLYGVGSGGVTALNNGHYVASSPGWNFNVGAVTWCNGTSGCTGTVSNSNSLVGIGINSQVGGGGVTELTNGHYLVLSPSWNNGGATNAGAVTWCSGTSGCTGSISAANSLIGNTTNDRIGDSYYVTELSSGNYVVSSYNWDNGGAVDAGAITWCSGISGCIGTISAANSLVGSTTGDRIGEFNVTELTSGHFVAHSPSWNDSGSTNAGAVTWCSGISGCTGVVSAANSLVGSTAYDQVGFGGVTGLSNGHYVVHSPLWGNGSATNAGAVTWCNGTYGCTGSISTANSLVGSTTNDSVGTGVTELTNGHYVVRSTSWNNGGATNAGAVTWCNGTSGCKGSVSSANSLVGSTTGDHVGYIGVTPLTNGHYVVSSWFWSNGGATSAGAVTWCNGASGCKGQVSAANSLVGGTAYDMVGEGGFAGNYVTELTNGNYVVSSPRWDSGGTKNVGAVTWCSGTSGCKGLVSTTNSLIGSTADDYVGFGGVTTLGNGNYVVVTSGWNNSGTDNAGAVTWCNGTTGCSGPVSSTNSLVGTTTGDLVGGTGLMILTNGNYLVRSFFWNNGGTTNAGAVTWCRGTTGCTGSVSSANSLVGGTANDQVSAGGVISLRNGHYLVQSPYWDNVGKSSAGALTWCNGSIGCTGLVSSTNSLVGSSANDQVGGHDDYNVKLLADGNYLVRSPEWDNSGTADAGAITLGDGYYGTVSGPVNADNSVLGTTAYGGYSMNWAYDDINTQLVVGRPADNIVTLFGNPYTLVLSETVYMPIVLKKFAP